LANEINEMDHEPGVDALRAVVNEALKSVARGEGVPIEEVWAEYGLTPHDGSSIRT
jgi:hypothetical protein